jgi:hypothetical protein
VKLTRFTPGAGTGCFDVSSSGPITTVDNVMNGISEVFEAYQQDWEAAKRTGLLEDKEIFAVERMVKHLREMLEVE